ncbi:MAG: hypothetical protein E7335_09500 [Clostridiales bacterium]|nr:hypothetical protein [Clostridiales bacterium]
MRRIQFACLEQTIHFTMKEDIPHDEAQHYLRLEVEEYKNRMQAKRVKHRVLEEIEQPDGTILLKIKKQYNAYPCGTYLED